MVCALGAQAPDDGLASVPNPSRWLRRAPVLRPRQSASMASSNESRLMYLATCSRRSWARFANWLVSMFQGKMEFLQIMGAGICVTTVTGTPAPTAWSDQQVFCARAADISTA